MSDTIFTNPYEAGRSGPRKTQTALSKIEDLSRASKVPANVLMAITERTGAADDDQRVAVAQRAAEQIAPRLEAGETIEDVILSSTQDKREGEKFLERARMIGHELYPDRVPEDPFEGESLMDLAGRRAQQFVSGAAEPFASVPEAAAIGRATTDNADTPASEMAGYERGKQIREAVGEADWRDESFWANLAMGAGNMVGMAGAALGAGAATGPGGAIATGAGLGSAMNTSQQYREALEAGADEDSAELAAKWGAAIGATEIIPIARALKIIPPKTRNKIAALAGRRASEIVGSAGEEAAQEYLSQVANNVVSQQIYDPERGWTEGAGEAALIGGILGGGMGAAGSFMGGGSEAEGEGPLDLGEDPDAPEDQGPLGLPAPAVVTPPPGKEGQRALPAPDPGTLASALQEAPAPETPEQPAPAPGLEDALAEPAPGALAQQAAAQVQMPRGEDPMRSDEPQTAQEARRRASTIAELAKQSGWNRQRKETFDALMAMARDMESVGTARPPEAAPIPADPATASEGGAQPAPAALAGPEQRPGLPRPETARGPALRTPPPDDSADRPQIDMPPADQMQRVGKKDGSPFGNAEAAKRGLKARGLDPEGFDLKDAEGGVYAFPKTEAPENAGSLADAPDTLPGAGEPVAEPDAAAAGPAPDAPAAAPEVAEAPAAAPDASVERKKDGAPFKSVDAAWQALANRGRALSDYAVIPEGNGYVARPKVESDRGEGTSVPGPETPAGADDFAENGPLRETLRKQTDQKILELRGRFPEDPPLVDEMRRRGIGEFSEPEGGSAEPMAESRGAPSTDVTESAKAKARAPKDFWGAADEETRRMLVSEIGEPGDTARREWGDLDQGQKRRVSKAYRGNPDAYDRDAQKAKTPAGTRYDESADSVTEQAAQADPEPTEAGGLQSGVESREAPSDGRLSDAKLFGDASVAEAIRAEGFQSLDRDRQGVVISHVLSALDELEVLQAVIKAVPVDVMDVFIRQEGTPERNLDVPTMLTRRLSISRDVPVSERVVGFIDALAASVEGGSARSSAKEARLSDMRSLAPERAPAGGARSERRLDARAGAENALAVPDPSGSGEAAAAGITDEDGHYHTSIAGQDVVIDSSPSDAQKEAGNYLKGAIRLQGLDITIENAKGSERRGTGPDGTEWSVTMPAHYGYVRGTEGADGDHVDVYLGDDTASDYVVIVNQADAETGRFDEHKIVLGTVAREEALDLYRGGFSDGKADERIGSTSTMTMDQFKDWLANGDTSKPTEPLDFPYLKGRKATAKRKKAEAGAEGPAATKSENAADPATETAKPAYGSGNKLVSADRAAEVRARLKDKLKNQLNSGIDPEILSLGAELAVFHIEAGVRRFSDVARAVATDLDTSPDQLRRYLRSWYNGARDLMEDSDVDVSGMDDASTVSEILRSGAFDRATEGSDNAAVPGEPDRSANADTDGQPGSGEGDGGERQGGETGDGNLDAPASLAPAAADEPDLLNQPQITPDIDWTESDPDTVIDDDSGSAAKEMRAPLRRQWETGLSRVESGVASPNDDVQLGRPGAVLRQFLPPKQNIVLRVARVRGVIEKHPEITMDVLRSLGAALDDPEFVLSSATRDDSIASIPVRLPGTDKPLIVSIRRDGSNRDGGKASEITSVYPKDDAGWLDRQIDAGRLLYSRDGYRAGGSANRPRSNSASVRPEGRSAPPRKGKVLTAEDVFKGTDRRGGLSGQETRITDADLQAIEAEAADELRRLGISKRVSLMALRGLANRGWFGRYERGTIGVRVEASEDAAGGWRGTLDHEAIHALRDSDLWNRSHGLFEADEWRALVRAARADTGIRTRVETDYPDLSTRDQSEEMVAELYREWAEGRRSAGNVAKALEKIRAFLTALANGLRGQGFTSAAGTLDAIASGRVGGRSDAVPVADTSASRPIGTASPRFQRAAAADGGAGKNLGTSFTRREWKKVSNLLTDAMQGKPGLLSLVPGRPLFAELGRRVPAAQTYLKLKTQMDAERQDWHAKTDEVAQAWRKLISKNGEANKRLMDLMHRATIHQVDPTLPFYEHATPQDAQLATSGSAYAAEQARKRLKEDRQRKRQYDRIKAEFDTLPKEMRAMFGKVRDTYTELADAFDDTIIDNVAKSADIALARAERAYKREMQRIKDARLSGIVRDEAVEAADEKLDRARKAHRRGKGARLASLRAAFETNRLRGPYFPLARFGNYFVTVRDPDGTLVSFSRFEKSEQQKEFANSARTGANTVEIGVVHEKDDLKDQVDPTFVAEIQSIIGDAGVPEATLDAVWQRWLETLPDTSIRTNRIHRGNVEGYNTDAYRAFGKAMFHGSHQYARLKYATDMGEALEKAGEQAAQTDDPNRAGMIVNEMRSRHEFTMNPKGSWGAQAATSAAFVYYLGVTPAAAIVNLSQTTVVGIPVLAAGFKTGTMTQASKQLGRALRDFTSGKGFAAESSRLTAREKEAMNEAYRRGTVDRTQSHDLAGVAETGVEYSAARVRIMGYISAFFHHTERMNREVTYLAAYRMSRAHGMDHKAAIDHASELTWKTHFDYSNTSRPRLLQNDFAKVALVFRNFQINMLYRLFRDMHQATKGKTPEERREARMQLGGITMMMMAHAGITGTWGYALATSLLGLFFDDGKDEVEEELQAGLVSLFGKEIAGMMLKGVPGHLTRTDLTSRLGMPELWFRSSDRQLEGDDVYNYWLGEVVGAVPGMGENVVRGVQKIGQGEYWRGIETAAPKVIRDLMQSARYISEGVTTYNGDPIVDQLSSYQAVVEAMGFSNAEVSEAYDRNTRLRNAEKRIMDERSRLHRRIGDNYNEEGAISVRNMRALIEFNAENPDYPITADTIRRSMGARQRMSDRNEGGVALNPRLNPRLREEQAPGLYTE